MKKQFWLAGAVVSCWTIAPAQQSPPQQPPPLITYAPPTKEFRLPSGRSPMGISHATGERPSPEF